MTSLLDKHTDEEHAVRLERIEIAEMLRTLPEDPVRFKKLMDLSPDALFRALSNLVQNRYHHNKQFSIEQEA